MRFSDFFSEFMIIQSLEAKKVPTGSLFKNILNSTFFLENICGKVGFIPGIARLTLHGDIIFLHDAFERDKDKQKLVMQISHTIISCLD